MSKLAELKAKQEALKAQILEEGKATFNEISKGLFDKYPNLESFSWRQYTPYFNDGDECVFSARTDYIDVMWGGKEIEELSDYTFDSSYTTPELKADLELRAFNKELQALFGDLTDKILKDMFGDHCKVIATKSGVTVEDYEHD